MMAYIAEFIGTFMLILLGDSVVANVSLNKSGMKGAGTVQITLAWGSFRSAFQSGTDTGSGN